MSRHESARAAAELRALARREERATAQALDLEIEVERLRAEVSILEAELHTTRARLEEHRHAQRALQDSARESADPAGEPPADHPLVVRAKSALRSARWLLEGTLAKRRLEGARAARIAPLFDAAYYVEKHDDMPRDDLSPVEHYLRYGAVEGRPPNALFDARYYVERYPDIRHVGANPLEHFITDGAREKRNPNRVFDTEYYLAHHTDAAPPEGNPLLHYFRNGLHARCNPHPLFDADYYMRQHPEIEEQGLNPLVHFLEIGLEKGFATNAAGIPLSTQQSLPPALAAEMRETIETFEVQPKFSIIMPVYDVEPEFLHRAIESVRRQVYPHWELCICDDGSKRHDTIEALRREAGGDERIRLVLHPENRHISRASNTALSMATGDYVAFLDNDDELAEHALLRMAERINRNPEVDVLHSDEDKVDPLGWLSHPFHKPSWSLELFRGVMYVGHFLVARRTLVDKIGGFDPTYDKVQDFELMLRLAEQTDRIEHIPEILYHWRMIPGSIASGSSAKGSIESIQSAAITAHLERLGVPAVAKPHPEIAHRAVLHPKPRTTHPKVSIIIPSKDAPQHIGRCLESIYQESTYPNFEVIVVDNGTTDPKALRFLNEHPIVRLPFDEKFNFSKANNLGVERATGDIVIMLNNDTEVLTPDWIETLLFHLELPNVGAVGPLLLFPDETVQHAGVVLGFRGTADHVLRGQPADSDGYAGSLCCTREVSAVTAACMMVRRADFLALGGMREDYRTIYQDVDFCMRIRARGQRILYTPRATLKHYESVSRGDDYDFFDRALLLDIWGDTIERGDPYYNPNFTLESVDYSLKLPVLDR